MTSEAKGTATPNPETIEKMHKQDMNLYAWRAHGYPDAVMENCGCVFEDAEHTKTPIDACPDHSLQESEP